MKSLRSFTSTRAVRELPNPPYYVSECQTGRQQHRLLHQRAHTRHELRLRKPASSSTLCTYTSQASAAVADPTYTPVQARMRAVNRAQYATQTTMSKEPVVHSSFEDKTGTWQYVVADPSTNRAVVIDPVLDYDANTQTISTQTADGLLATISENGYRIEKILETHAHADHLTAASYLQQRLSSQQGFRPPICIGKRIREVQARFAARYGITAVEYENAFDHLFEDDEVFKIGQLEVKVMHLPGHTPDHIGYRIGGNVFCGDSIFHADIGTARCDFPGGSAKSLYASARKLLELPDDVKIWTGHDYPACPERCEAVPWMTVRDHKEKNKHLANDVEEDDFLTLRKERDASLAAPKLLHPSLQINIRAGRLPLPTSGDQRLMHLPIRISGTTW